MYMIFFQSFLYQYAAEIFQNSVSQAFEAILLINTDPDTSCMCMYISTNTHDTVEQMIFLTSTIII